MVVPTNRPEKYREFYAAWAPLFDRYNALVIKVVDDEQAAAGRPDWIPQKTDMCRSWGMYEAWRSGREFILTLDDDVRPWTGVDIFRQYERIFARDVFVSEYLNIGELTSASPQPLRGFPYADRAPKRAAIQYGGWHGALDYDAPTQLVRRPVAGELFDSVALTVPRGAPVTTCIMNAAWRREYTPLMWQLPMLEGRYNRFGDIWSGLLQKRTLDRFGLPMVINGEASVLHDRASNVFANLEREAPGIRINETLWEWLNGGDWLTGFSDSEPRDMIGFYRSLLEHFARMPVLDPRYAEHLREAASKWLALFS